MLLTRAAASGALVLAFISQAPQTSAPPVDATITVRLAAGKTTYHVGEEIPLELEFLGHAGAGYYFSTETSDRSGRMSTERYVVTPQGGTDDPLTDFFADGFIGGGLRSSHPLDGIPLLIHVSLNDWVHIAQPGTYRLAVTSDRLHRNSSGPVQQLIAAPVEFTITAADNPWAAAEVKRAADLLDGGSDDVHRGTTTLRYLGTEAAARVLLDRFHDIAQNRNGEWDVAAALLSSTRRAVIVHDMEARLDGGGALDPGYFSVLTRLKLLLEIPRDNNEYAARSARRTAIQAEYDSRWRAAMARRPITPEVLAAELAQLPSATDAVRERTRADLAAHPAEAAAAMTSLPARTQQTLLEHQWPVLNRPWISPVLRRIYDRWHGDYRFAGAGDAALRHLNELVPDEGRRLILDEITTGDRGIGYDVLASLSDATLPALDAALRARRLRRLDDNLLNIGFQEETLWLIARYGSPALMPMMVNLGTFRTNQCAGAAPFLMYLLKHDPERGARQLESCTRVRYTQLAPRYWDDHVQAAAIAALDHADPADAIEAAQALGQYASAAAKAPLLDRLRRWSNEWRGRAAELDVLRSQPTTSPEVIENNVSNALFDNKTFALTKDEAAEIRTLCISDGCRVNVDGRARAIR